MDVPDIIIFMDDWLWVACWRIDIRDYLEQTAAMLAAGSEQMMAGGGESMMMSGLQDEPVLTKTSSIQMFYEPLVVQQTESIQPDESAPAENSGVGRACAPKELKQLTFTTGLPRRHYFSSSFLLRRR